MIKKIQKIIYYLRGYEFTFEESVFKIPKNEFELMVKLGVRKNKIFNIEFQNITDFSFKFVKLELPYLMENGKFTEVIKLCLKKKKIKVSEKQINAYNHNHLLSFILWIRDELDSIEKMEKRELNSNPSIELMAAGINKLDKLGYVNVIDEVAGGDVLKWNKVIKLPYNIIFQKQLKTKIENDINKKIHENRTKKNK